MNSAAKKIAEGVRKEIAKIPGSRVVVHFHEDFGCEVVSWSYDCPCGETICYDHPVGSYYHNFNARDVIEMITSVMKEAMRRHVRGEGNEPSF